MASPSILGTGDIVVNLSDKGFYRSTDQGKTWMRACRQAHQRPHGNAGLSLLDPFGKSKKIVTPWYTVRRSWPAATAVRTGRRCTTSRVTSIGAPVDWSDPDMKFVLTLKHESGDLLLVLRDGGQNFEDVGKGYGPAWIFDGKTAVVAEAKSKTKPKPRLLRTTDGAKTFEAVRRLSRQGAAAGTTAFSTGSWTAPSFPPRTQGKSWQKLGNVKDGRFGPVFGKDAKHMFVLTGAGVIESTDGGAKVV